MFQMHHDVIQDPYFTCLARERSYLVSFPRMYDVASFTPSDGVIVMHPRHSET